MDWYLKLFIIQFQQKKKTATKFYCWYGALGPGQCCSCCLVVWMPKHWFGQIIAHFRKLFLSNIELGKMSAPTVVISVFIVSSMYVTSGEGVQQFR